MKEMRGTMNRSETTIGNIVMKNPVMTASGTAGHCDELSQIAHLDISALGAFLTKGITLYAREGNPQLRIVETSSGILNSIGLQNKGIERFLWEDLKKLKRFGIPIILNISVKSIDEVKKICSYIRSMFYLSFYDGIEINVSCPNIEGNILGHSPEMVHDIVHEFRFILEPYKTIITKLSPNVTNIVEIAEAAIYGGTDALSMINTVRGTAIDIDNKKFLLGNKIGGLSGPAIKPIGLLAVHECFTKIEKCSSKEIPIIGVGGIMNYKDALEYIMVGASAIQIGTGFFTNANIYNEVISGIDKYLQEQNKNVSDIIGIIL